MGEELQAVQRQLAEEKERSRRTWKLNCEHVAEHDRLITAKDDEIADLKRQLEALCLQQRSRGETTLAARTAGRDGSRSSIMDGSRRQENLSPPRHSPSPVTDGHTPHTANVSTAPASVHTGPVD